MHFLNKVSEIVLRIKDDEVLSEVLDTLSILRELPTKEKTSLIDKTLAQVLTEYPSTLHKHQELFENVLASVIGDTDLVNRHEYYRRYLKILYNTKKFTVLLAKAKEMHTQFPQNNLPLGESIINEIFRILIHYNIIICLFFTEWICRVYYEETVLNENELEIDIICFCEFLLKLNMNSEMALISKAAYLMLIDNLIDSRECLNQVILLNAQSFYAWFLLNKVYCKLYCWEEVEDASRQALRLLKSSLKDQLQHKIKLTLLEAMSRSNDRRKLLQAREICEEVGIAISNKVSKFSENIYQ